MKKESIFLTIVVLLSAIAFSPAIFTGFSKIDDSWMLLGNPYIKVVSSKNIWTVFTNSYHGQYSPINTIYYSLFTAIHGLNPVAFHIYNILAHCANVIVVYFVLREISLKYQFTPEDATVSALLISLVFGIHPMQVESVVWISASKILIHTTFFLLGMLSYIKYLKTGKTRYYLLTVLTFITSFLAKEQAVVFPIVLFLVSLLYINSKNEVKYQFIKILPLFLISFLFSWISYVIQEQGFGSRLSNNYYPIVERFF